VIEAAVLRLLLIEHPRKLRRSEILQTLSHPRDDRAVIERAIRNLIAVGLVEHEGDYLVPSRAAVRFDELPVD
jgi:predicted transcriptional regulator